MKGRFRTENEAAEYLAEKGLKVAPKTLGKYRVLGGGPKFRKWGRVPLYDEPALDEWVDEKLSDPMRSTSEMHAGGHQAVR
jgi:hypothetical protein